MSRFKTLLVVIIFASLTVTSSAASYGQAQSPMPPQLLKTVRQAQALIGQQDFAGAEKLLRPTVKKYKQRAPWYLLGYSLHAQKKYEEALTAYRKAVTNPTVKTNSLYNIACINSLQGKKDEAFAKINEAIQAGFSNFAGLQADADFNNIKNDPRFQKLQPKWLGDDKLFVEPTRIIHKWSGEAAGDQFGWTARRVGDLDNDQVIDFVATAPTHAKGAGKIYVYSSKSGKQLFAITGKPGDRLGNSAVGLGDVNGDDISDLIAGAPNSAGKGAVFVYSGKDGSTLRTIRGTTASGQFGYEVSELGDVDGDSVPDYIVGEMAGNGKAKSSGRVIAYSGKTGDVLFELRGERTGDGFGNAVAAAQTKPGEFLLAVGAQNAGPRKRGRVYVYEIVNSKPKLKFKIEGDKNSVNLGQMFISFPGDLDGDGTPDVYASDFSDNTKANGGGKVVVHSGQSGKELLAIHGTVAGEGLGTSPSDAGDVDGDGIGDLVVGAWQNREGATSGGKVYLYSAAGNGKLLRSWTARQAGDTLGFDACGIGDVDGDGNVDFLLTSAWSNKLGLKTGRVFIVAGDKFANPSSTQTTTPPAKLIAGEVTTVLDNLPGGTGGINVDAQGNIYSADFGSRLGAGGTGGHRLFKITPAGKSTLFCDQLKGGSGNTFNKDGVLFQSSIGGNFISKISTEGKAEVFTRKGIRNPVGLAFNSQQDLFVCNCGSNSIQKVTPDGASTLFCNNPLLKCPNGVAVGPDDTLYVCNFGNGDVLMIDRHGNISRLATLPGKNNGHLVYHRGYLYVIARTDCRIFRVDLAGRVEVFAGNAVRGKQDGDALNSSFSLPNSLIVSPDEKWLYVNETAPTSGDPSILAPTRIRRIAIRVE